MPPVVPSADRDMLSRYLVGEISVEEENKVEDQFARDDVYFSLLEKVERELIRDYALGRLQPAEASLFERNYLVTAERQTRVSFVRALVTARNDAPDAFRSESPSLRSLKFALVAGAVIVGVVLFLWQQPKASVEPFLLAGNHQTAERAVVQRDIPRVSPPIPEAQPAAGATANSEPHVALRKTRTVPRRGWMSVIDSRGTTATKVPRRSDVQVVGAGGRPVTAARVRSSAPPSDNAMTTLAGDGTFSDRPSEVWVEAIRKRLESEYRLAETAVSGSGNPAPVVLHMGLEMVADTTQGNACINTYQENRITESLGCRGGRVYIPSFRAVPETRPITSRHSAAGERLWLNRIEVRDTGGAGVIFHFRTDAIGGIYYKGSLVFPFGTDIPSAEEILKETLAIMTPSSDTAPASQGVSARDAAHSFDIPVNIVVGQRIDQVTAALGAPEKIVEVGSKKIYFYKSLKITFVADRVTEVQDRVTKIQ